MKNLPSFSIYIFILCWNCSSIQFVSRFHDSNNLLSFAVSPIYKDESGEKKKNDDMDTKGIP